MKKIFYLFFFFISIFSSEEEKIKTLFYGLNQKSIKEHLAFYSLFPQSPWGIKALNHTMDLINLHRKEKISIDYIKAWPELDITPIVQAIGQKMNVDNIELKKEEIECIQFLSSHLHHNSLSGHKIQKFVDFSSLEEKEIDLARAIFLYQFKDDLEKVILYEAALDLMALEILAKLPATKKTEEILKALHELIFFEMGFRFPPHSLWAKDVDVFTFLPSVMDDRFGVCLGVSILYLSLGQRLGINFQIYTPPGHIFLQAKLDDNTLVNIETTARGIHIPMEHYLGMNCLYLPERTIKESIGLALMNFAAVSWEQNNYNNALSIYLEAKPFLNKDPLLHYFITINSLLCKKDKLAKENYDVYLKNIPSNMIQNMTMLEDYYENKTDIEGLKLIFQHVDENRSSILKKQKELELYLKKYPNFKEGHFQLGICYLQLMNLQKAKNSFSEYHNLDQSNPTVEYYLAHLCINRLDYKKAFYHYKNLESLFKNHNKRLKMIQPLEQEILRILCSN